MRKKLALFVLAATAAAAIVTLVVVLTPTTAEAAPCRCPQIYAPVICDNGQTYPNQCVADCRHARNCVPTGDI